MKKAVDVFVDVLAVLLCVLEAAAFFALLVWGVEPQHNAHNDVEMEVR